jgi:hypothetical protein
MPGPDRIRSAFMFAVLVTAAQTACLLALAISLPVPERLRTRASLSLDTTLESRLLSQWLSVVPAAQ